MNKEEVIYYAYRNNDTQTHGLLYGQEPTVAKKDFIESFSDTKELRFLKCPAYMDQMKNVYSVPSQFDFDVNVENYQVSSLGSEPLSQDFFDSYITTHSPKDRLYGIRQNVIFIAESDSLKVSQEHPFLVDTKWARDVYTIPGKLDIGKYFRTLECAFIIRKNVKELHLKEGDPFYYMRFHTNKQIKLVPFYWSVEFEAMVSNLGFHGSATHKWRPLQWYYERVKKKGIKNLLLKEIKKNILG